jgi:hypothetical protein
MTDESTKIPSYLNIKEIKIELKAFLSNKYVLKKLVPVTFQKAFIHVENSVNIPFHVNIIY